MISNIWRNEVGGLLPGRRCRRPVAIIGTPRRPTKRRVRPGLEALEERIVLASDFGDAPQPYFTTLAEDGARHEAIGTMFGGVRDSEADGMHSANADADDTTGSPDDEDGVTFPASIAAGQLGVQITVNVSSSPAGAKLDAWIDFDGDGNWGGPQERIASGVAVVNGDNLVTFDVPSGAPDGVAYAHFRLSTAGNLAVRGAAADGEVEDHTLTLSPPAAASGVFSAEHTISTEVDGAIEVYPADVDGDGDLDVISSTVNDGKVAWHENDGAANFTSHPIATTHAFTWSVNAADVDGDGDLDVLSAGNLNAIHQVAWYENDGAQNFTTHLITGTAFGADSVYAADVDGDGDLDVLSSSFTDSKIAWYENDGTPAVGPWTARTISAQAFEATWVHAADVDRDGDMDALSSSCLLDMIAWYENDGAQDFARHIISTAADCAAVVYTADVDGDGDTDVLSASSNDDKIAWYENDGAENFAPHTISTTADGAIAMNAADVDGDGDLDVLSASIYDDKIAWYENDGNENFTARTISVTADGADGVYAADVDADGDLDVLSASPYDDTIAWYENLPDGDFDNDGDHDCADVNALTNAVAHGGSLAQFDLNGDNILSLADVDAWRVEAGGVNIGPGRVYRPGDANLSGAVDGSDFDIWNANKFTLIANWCDGDFNSSGAVDGTDFGIWNANKFTSSDANIRIVAPVAVATPRLSIGQRHDEGAVPTKPTLDVRLELPRPQSQPERSPVTAAQRRTRVVVIDRLFADAGRPEDPKPRAASLAAHALRG